MAFTDVKLNEKQPNESYWNVYVPDTSQGSSFHSYFSYSLLSVSWLHPFEITRGIYGQQIHYAHTKLQAYPELIWHVWQRVDN